jgi:hypothetical protein
VIKIEIKYEDFDGNERVEDHYFHLSKRELTEMVLDGWDPEATVKSGDPKLIMETFRDVISKAYGLRDVNDPRKFAKSQEISEEFLGSLAYDEFFGRLTTNVDEAINFINGVVPKDLRNSPEIQQAISEGRIEAARTTQGQLASNLEETSGLKHPWDREGNLLPWSHREPTSKELQGMTKAQLAEVFLRKNNPDWTPTVGG